MADHFGCGRTQIQENMNDIILYNNKTVSLRQQLGITLLTFLSMKCCDLKNLIWYQISDDSMLVAGV